ncbi:unnamed protein product [marine sediment metagenome]|uniref:Uncharacterized protein n=1 Tax=marine sediment metagenome TaxID=412755 RepID=X1VBS6_9ZZZZ
MSPQVTIKRTEMLVPTIDDPERKIYMIEYRSGELSPKFLYISVKEWTKELEAKMIKEDISKRLVAPEEIIEI